MAKRPRFLIIAILLTVLEVAVVICYGWPVWATWSGDIWNGGIEVLLAALGATSLANVWAQMLVPAQNILSSDRSADCEEDAVPIPTQVRGQANV
jgi:predicted phage tail protein